jgi:hypothetical protein
MRERRVRKRDFSGGKLPLGSHLRRRLLCAGESHGGSGLANASSRLRRGAGLQPRPVCGGHGYSGRVVFSGGLDGTCAPTRRLVDTPFGILTPGAISVPRTMLPPMAARSTVSRHCRCRNALCQFGICIFRSRSWERIAGFFGRRQIAPRPISPYRPADLKQIAQVRS